MKKIVDFIRKYVIVWSATMTVLGALGGFVSSYYFMYRPYYIAGLQENYKQFLTTQDSVDETLKALASMASGENRKDAKTAEKLRLQLLASVRSARDLSLRVNNTKKLIGSFEDAAVQLAEAFDEFTGPENGKALVEAASDYSVARDNITEAVLKEETKFLR